VAARVTFERVQQLVCDWFPDPDPKTASVRGFRAIVSLLLSAVVLGTVEPGKLQQFTGYHPAFIASVASNMRNNHLWTAHGYDASHWLSPAGEMDERLFLEDFDVAAGSTWCPDAEFFHDAVDAWDVYQELESKGAVHRFTLRG
jgi:hypothetical protein